MRGKMSLVHVSSIMALRRVSSFIPTNCEGGVKRREGGVEKESENGLNGMPKEESYCISRITVST